MRQTYDDTIWAIAKCEVKISTYVTHFFSMSQLALGYRLFAHLPGGQRVEVKFGKNEYTDRIIREGHDLEKLLLAGEFGEI